MRAVWATYTRELRAYFFAPLAYVVLFFFLIVTGVIFINLIGNLVDPRIMAPDPALTAGAGRMHVAHYFAPVLPALRRTCSPW